MKFRILTCAVLLACGGFAAPEISNLSIDYAERRVKIAYRLTDGPAIVTAKLFADGEALPPESLGTLAGDLGASVASGDRLIVWNALKDRPDLVNLSKTLRVELKAYPTEDPPDYVVVPLVANAKAKLAFYETAAEIPGGLGVAGDDVCRTNSLVLRRIRARDVIWTRGSFYNGFFSDNNDPKRQLPHEVCLSNDYWMAVYELTNAQFDRLCNGTVDHAEPFKVSPAVRPCSKLYYTTLRLSTGTIADYQAVDHPENPPPSDTFLGAARAFTGLPFDLPTESEWEFAGKAGTTPNRWNTGALVTNETCDANCPGRYSRNGGQVWNGSSWVDAPSTTSGLEAGTAKVGCYAPNAWGLYDMHGNVMEWCRDFCKTDPSALLGALNSTFVASTSAGHESEGVHTLRGCYYVHVAAQVQLAKRTGERVTNSYAGMGCRLVLPLDFTRSLTGN